MALPVQICINLRMSLPGSYMYFKQEKEINFRVHKKEKFQFLILIHAF